jgi:hypothetical protein
MELIAKLLTLYFWIGVVGLILLLNRIARFYQVTTGVRSYYRMFLIPVVLFLGGMARYASIDRRIAGDVLGDLLLFLGGISLTLLGYLLLKLMTGGRQ